MEEIGKIGNIESVNVNGGTAIKSTSTPFTENFYFSDFYEEKKLKNFIKSTEKLIRTSKEYSFYIAELRTNFLALDKDSIQGNISVNDVDLEFHHYPFSLYDLIESIIYYNIAKDIKFNSFTIARDIMRLHFEHKIGLVSLTKTNHQLAHNGKLFISKQQIFGDYHKFLEKYKDGISVNLKKKIEEMETLSNDNKTLIDFLGIYK